MTALVTKHIELLSSAPSGIEQLRMLFRRLAVIGRLSTTGASDLVQTEWRNATFGQVFSLEYGDNLPAPKRSGTGEFPVYGSNGVVGSHNECCVSAPCIVVGRKGSAGAVNICEHEGCWVTDVAYSCVPPGDVALRFAYVLFQTLGLDGLGKGIKPGLSRSEAYALPVSIPPLAEQHRIVAKVDELMELCDRLEAEQADAEAAHAKLVEALLASLTHARDAADFRASWQQLAEHFHTLFTTEASIDALKQAVLRLAVMGRLVPQDLNDEPASELLKKVSADGLTIANGGKRKENGISQRDNSDQPFQLPAGWEWGRVDDLVSIKHGYAFSSSHFIEHSGPFVLATPGNFFEVGGFRERGARTKYYDGPMSKEFILCPGDLIIAMTEQAAGLLGSAAFIPDDGKTYLHNQRLGKLIFNPEQLAPQYLYYFFNCPLLRASVAASSTGMKVKHTSPDKVGRVPLPLPPLREQHRIAAKVGELLSLCDQLKLDIEAARQRQEHLASVLVEQSVA